jgi:hypothetical protein
MWTKCAAPMLAMVVAANLADSCKERATGVTESQPEQQWAVARRDAHGWSLHALNAHAADVHVDDLDTTALPSAGLDDASLVVHGTLRSAVFEVDAAYRGIPDATWSQDDVFVQMKDTSATQLNLDISTEVPALDLARVESNWLDHAWLENRIRTRGAVLAGQFVGEPGGRGILGFQVDEVFVSLPDRARECPKPVRFCPRGMIRAYTRDVDRCLVPDGCVEANDCASAPPACPSGLVLRTWRSAPHGCREYVCDPSFLRD